MVINQNLLSQTPECAPAFFPDLFLCPMCGSVGSFGQSGFICTDRPAWFRCASCEYVFAFERPRPMIVAERYHEL